MKELRPDPPWWLASLKRHRPVPEFVRGRERAANRWLNREILHTLTGGHGATLSVVVVALGGLRLMMWITKPRARVVYRARIDPGDRLELRGLPRR